MMRPLLKILFALLITLPAFAQEDDLQATVDPKVQEKVRAAHIAYITDQLALTPEEAEATDIVSQRRSSDQGDRCAQARPQSNHDHQEQ